jgi:hypothetical protein
MGIVSDGLTRKHKYLTVGLILFLGNPPEYKT